MATLTIRNLPESTKQQLRVRAAENGRSMEEEARLLLTHGVLSTCPRYSGFEEAPARNWVDEIAAKMRSIGETELILPEREPVEDPIDFSGPEFQS